MVKLHVFGNNSKTVNNKIWKVNGRTTVAKWWQYLTWPFGSGELKKGAFDSVASDKVYQLLAHGRGGSLLVLQLLPWLKMITMI
jgi:hypothetical protein